MTLPHISAGQPATVHWSNADSANALRSYLLHKATRMFTMVRVYIKTAIVFLMAGLLLGTILLVRRELYGIWASGPLLSAHTHALLLGFGLFLIMGVALWLFPKPGADDTRYTPARIKTAYWMLMPATALRFASEIVRSLGSVEWLAWVIVLAGLTQFVAIGLYFYAMWGRIRAVGSHLREARGERF